jgi:hypothetical protein
MTKYENNLNKIYKSDYYSNWFLNWYNKWITKDYF